MALIDNALKNISMIFYDGRHKTDGMDSMAKKAA